ncbi:MAG TPA: terminase family protein [Stellaceae bacterium]|nr:terminase family protein [Stellaceae bacterium]
MQQFKWGGTRPHSASCAQAGTIFDPAQSGIEAAAAWCDELGAWRYPEAWDMLMFGMRLGADPHTVVTTTPRPAKLIRDMMRDPISVVTRGSSSENRGIARISYLPAHGMRRHYTTPANSDFPGFYVGDVTDFDDLVTYWNLRAADISLSFVDPNHLDRFSDLIPVWEKQAHQLLTRAPEHRKRVAVWAHIDDHQAALELFGERLTLFCPINDHSTRLSTPTRHCVTCCSWILSIGADRCSRQFDGRLFGALCSRS